jgi:hypothetical protein
METTRALAIRAVVFGALARRPADALAAREEVRALRIASRVAATLS